VRRFIETEDFPIDLINEKALKEKQGGGRPPIWEMVFWWTRKPLVSARAIIAGSLLPADISKEEFIRYLRLNEKVPHRHNPSIPEKWRKYFDVSLWDPFAGFGSIPFEAIRLGVREVYASDLLPTAYVFLKAVLEYPLKIVKEGKEKEFLEELKRAGEEIIEKLKNDPEIKDLYEEDVAVYIGTWEVKCPHCGRYTPLVRNWWLARVKDSKGKKYKRLAWMVPKKAGDRIEIEVVDLNEKYKDVSNAKVDTKNNVVRIGKDEYRLPEVNVDAQRSIARCLHCNNLMPGKGDKWYVKEALREWNQNYERYLRGEISLEELKNSKARPRILVKVKKVGKDLKFEPATEEDNEKLWIAAERLRKYWGDPDIPTEEIAPYANRYIFPILYGFDKWFKLFNPRQLMVAISLVKILKHVDRGEGSRERDLLVPLALWITNFMRYFSEVTLWDPTYWGTLKVKQIFSMRGISLQWNWCEFEPMTGLRAFLGYLINAYGYAVSNLREDILKGVRIIVELDNIVNSTHSKPKYFYMIITDPPYKDDVPYTELSDFYYVWLKRALSDVEDLGGMKVLRPKYLPEAFFDELGNEIETQWKHFADKEISEDEGRSKYFGKGVGSFEDFKRKLGQAFINMANSLKDDGLLVTYYAHTSPEAWEALLEAGWQKAGLRVSTSWPVVTESAESVVKRGKASLDISLVVVWRKGRKGNRRPEEAAKEALEECAKVARRAWIKGHQGMNLFVYTMGCVLSHFTKYEKLPGIKGDMKKLVSDYVYPTTVKVLLKALVGEEVLETLSPPSTLYLAMKILVPPGKERRKLNKDMALILSLTSTMELKDFVAQKVLKEVKGKGSKEYVLLEPHGSSRVEALRSLIKEKGLNPSEPEPSNAVDALHLLEYYALRSASREEFLRSAEKVREANPRAYEEALALARALCTVLSEEEAEAKALLELTKVLGIECRVVSKGRKDVSLESFAGK